MCIYCGGGFYERSAGRGRLRYVIRVYNTCETTLTEFWTDISMRALVFLGRVANELSSSPFLPNISSGTDAGHGSFFVHDLHWQLPLTGIVILQISEHGCEGCMNLPWTGGADIAYGRFLSSIMSRVLPLPEQLAHQMVRDSRTYANSSIPDSRPITAGASSSASPSAPLIQALLSISTSVQNVGMSSDPSSRTTLAEATLRHFMSSVLEGSPGSDTYRRGQQFLWDLRYLHKISALWGSDWGSTTSLLKEEIDRANAEVRLALSTPVGIHTQKSNRRQNRRSLQKTRSIRPYQTISRAPNFFLHLSSHHVHHQYTQAKPEVRRARRARFCRSVFLRESSRCSLRWSLSSLRRGSGCCWSVVPLVDSCDDNALVFALESISERMTHNI